MRNRAKVDNKPQTILIENMEERWGQIMIVQVDFEISV